MIIHNSYVVVLRGDIIAHSLRILVKRWYYHLFYHFRSVQDIRDWTAGEYLALMRSLVAKLSHKRSRIALFQEY